MTAASTAIPQGRAGEPPTPPNALERDTPPLRRHQAPEPLAGQVAAPGTPPTAETRSRMPPEVARHFVRVGERYYYQQNPSQLTFTDAGHRLETPSSSTSIAEQLVRIAEARGWHAIKVTGADAFRREVWLEAARRGMQAKGYTPSAVDQAQLAQRHQAVERPSGPPPLPDHPDRAPRVDLGKPAVSPAARSRASAYARQTPVEAVAQHPELAGAAAIAAAIALKATADGLTPAQRDVVQARVRENIVKTLDAGQLPQVRVRAVPARRAPAPQNEADLGR